MNPFRTATVNAYREVGLDTGIADAGPHQVVLMLFDGALAAIVEARSYISARNIPAKIAAISRAIRIINEGLRSALDMERGGQIAVQLRDLYDYMMGRLVEANLKNSQAALAEVTALLCEIRAAWVQIGEPPAAAPASLAVAPVPRQDRRAVSYGAA